MRLQHRGRHALTFFFVLPIVLQIGNRAGEHAIGPAAIGALLSGPTH